MYKKILVSDLIDEGKLLLEALVRNRFPIVAALWNYFPESMEWRLVIVSPIVDRDGPLRAYTRIQRVLAKISPLHLTLSDITAIGSASQDYQTLRAIISSPGGFSTGSGASRVPQDAVFEDAYIYQLPR